MEFDSELWAPSLQSQEWSDMKSGGVEHKSLNSADRYSYRWIEFSTSFPAKMTTPFITQTTLSWTLYPHGIIPQNFFFFFNFTNLILHNTGKDRVADMKP